MPLALTTDSFDDSFDFAPVAMLKTKPDGIVLAVNAAARQWLQGEEESLVGQSCARLFNDELDFRQLILLLAHDNRTVNCERRVQSLAGRRYWASIQARRLDEAGYCLWVVHDLTAHHQQLETVRLETQRFRLLLECSAEGYVSFDLRTLTILEVNPAVSRLLERSADEIVGKPITAFTHPDSLSVQQQMLTDLVDTPQRQYELCLLKRQGQTVDVQISSTTLFDEQGLPLSAFALILDISERKRNEERILYLALYDSLTALPNRILLQERLQQALLDRERRGGMLGLLFVDLDNFKQINDSLGHEGGDSLLQALARRLHRVVRKSDTVARLGGDEFVVVLPNIAGRAAAAQVAAKILQALQPPFEISGQPLTVSCSVGIAIAPDDGDSGDKLKQQADKAMYLAKARGKHQFAFSPIEPNHESAV